MVILHYFVFLAYRAMDVLVTFLPLQMCWLVGTLGGNLSYWFLPKQRKIVSQNLYLALGDEMGKRECRRIARRYFGAFGRNRLCGWKLQKMSPAAIERKIRYENRQVILDLMEQGQGVIAAWTHIGPWEALASIPAFGPGVERGILYRSTSNPFLETYLQRLRPAESLKLFPQGTGLHGPMDHLDQGGVLGVAVDRFSDAGSVWCPLFKRLTSTSNQAALLSVRTGAPIIPLGLYPERMGRWRLVFGEPILPPDSEAEASSGRITARLNVAVEQVIRRGPEEWSWVHSRWKTPNPEFLLSAYRRGIEYPPGQSEDSLKPFRMLVRSPNWLGDACMTVPTVRALKKGRPDAEITILCSENLRAFWENVRHVDHVVAKGARKAPLLKAVQLIRREGAFHAGVLFPNSVRSGLEMRLAGIEPVVGYASAGRTQFLDQEIEGKRMPGPPEHHAWRYMRIAHAVGADQSDPDLYAHRAHRPVKTGPWKIGICPGAAYGDAKRWPVERFAEAVETIHRRWDGGVEWVIYGAPNETEIAERFEAKCSVEVENLVGKTNLSELMDDLGTIHTLITNDTGTMHLAALFGIPTVAIFGSTEPSLTSPIGTGHRVLRHHVECSPCFLRDCPRDFRCMTSVTVEEVVNSVEEILAEQKSTEEPKEAATTG
ncbi:MAG: lipopolysaccharide heptosyltransferase II [Verrucomicrobiota bacterium]